MVGIRILPQRSLREAPKENLGPVGPPYFATSSGAVGDDAAQGGMHGHYFMLDRLVHVDHALLGAEWALRYGLILVGRLETESSRNAFN